MKAISLWQPWASAVARGAKRIETRSWATNYRGRIAIHASKRYIKTELLNLLSHWHWCGALNISMGLGGDVLMDGDLPLGALIATADLVDCRPVSELTILEVFERRRSPDCGSDLYAWTEWDLGDYALGRFAWMLDNIRLLPEPIPYRGAQGFFEISDEIIGAKI